MIDHEWRAGDIPITGDSRDELHRLLTEAAEADAEAGFPSFTLDDVVPAGTRYLLIWLLPDERTGRDDPPPTLAGCLRLEPSGSSADGAEVRLVIHPELRSRGIATALCEQVGLDTGPDDGWAGTGCARLRCWARGDHPAAQRLSLRFSGTGLRRARREWRLVALLRRSADETAATGTHSAEPGKPGVDALWRNAGRPGSAPKDGRVLIAGSEDSPGGAAWFDPDAGEPTEYGPAGLVRAVLVDSARADSAQADSAQANSAPADSGRAGERVVASLLDATMAALQADGSTVAAITVADHEEKLLAACRIAGFQHDRTDCEYVLD